MEAAITVWQVLPSLRNEVASIKVDGPLPHHQTTCIFENRESLYLAMELGIGVGYYGRSVEAGMLLQGFGCCAYASDHASRLLHAREAGLPPRPQARAPPSHAQGPHSEPESGGL